MIYIKIHEVTFFKLLMFIDVQKLAEWTLIVNSHSQNSLMVCFFIKSLDLAVNKYVGILCLALKPDFFKIRFLKSLKRYIQLN